MSIQTRRRIIALLMLPTLVAGLVSGTHHAVADESHVVINEVYTRGGSANQPYQTKFVELYNGTGAPIDLAGLTLSYGSATSSTSSASCELNGTIAAGGYFLIGTGSNGSNGVPLGVDVSCAINPSGTGGTLVLQRGSEIVDLVGYGTAVRNETQAASYPGNNAVAGSISRTDGVDTGNNAADFTFSATPSPTPAAITPSPTPQPATVTIAQIQGTGVSSPLVGQQVTTTGVVTAVYPTGGFDGFYLQTPGTGGTVDATPGASDAIFVHGHSSVPAGSCQTVTGTVGEYNGLTELTNITPVPATGCAPVAETPLATLPDEAGREALEGMLVRPEGQYTITNNYQLNQYGQLGLAVGDEPLYQATDVVPPGAEAEAYERANQSRYITLDDGSSWDYLRNAKAQASPLPYLGQAAPMRTGARVSFKAPVILDFRSQWSFQPVSQIVGHDDASIPVTVTNDRPTSAPAVGGDVQLGSFNVLNYFTDLGQDESGCGSYDDRAGNPVTTRNCQVRGAYTPAAFADQQAKLVSAINSMGADLVALMEVENSAGISYVFRERDYTLGQLVSALNAAGGHWALAPSPLVTPSNEDVIRTAFIYNPEVVTPDGSGEILLDAAFANARYPFKQAWRPVGSDAGFTTIVNHFKSKGSGEDDGTGQGLSNPSREAQARALTAWAAGIPGAAFLMGDFNAYSRETPVQLIEQAGYTNLVRAADAGQIPGWAGGGHSTTYQYGGRLGSLDHVFANGAGLAMVVGAGVWDINADEAVAMQYSRRNYNAVDFYTTDPFASSDHDPALVGLRIQGNPAPNPSQSPGGTNPGTPDSSGQPGAGSATGQPAPGEGGSASGGAMPTGRPIRLPNTGSAGLALGALVFAVAAGVVLVGRRHS